MLSRTASELFWMARYLERAESYARVLDVTWKLSMIPRHSQQSRDLALPLNLSMTHELFQARHARFTMSNLLNFFALDGNNPCSIYSCVEMAWNNAHAVRGSLSAEVWESINATRIELRTLRQQGLGELGSDGFFEWVKERVHLFRGAVIGTLLRNDALSFIGIGTLIERAFATTQLLLIKDQQLTNDPDPVREYYRLDTLLNAVSAREAYNSLYRQPVSRETVMELLILRNDIPRSLRASIADLVGELEKIANTASGLLGISGLSSDLRVLEQAWHEGHARARLAIKTFVHRIARHIAGHAAALQRLDGIIFTGGIGENSVLIRRLVSERLAVFGLAMDAARNQQPNSAGERLISADGSRVRCAVIPTNEERMIALDAIRLGRIHTAAALA
ncbi:alpha-E domain-containing protein [Klebsiella pneumoniae]